MNLQQFVLLVIELIREHQHLALPLIFLFAFSEALVAVALFTPGAAILLGIGALVGLNVLSFFPTFLAIAIGAISGNVISYYLGRYYEHKIINSWPLKKYPNAILRTQKFFIKYGVLSIFIGRFTGPTRAFVPFIAGSMHMNSIKFNIANVISAPLWAFVVLQIGMLSKFIN